ncbi:MAG: YaeQ family protein, partial [Burkholderiales bacterium]|nr:YaeQ family protein [Burkholderiales bacterium]
SPEETSQLAALAERSMRLSCTLQEGNAWIGSDHAGCNVEPKHLQRGSDERGA